MLNQSYDEVVSSALDHWLDLYPLFTKADLLTFPWIDEDLADEEIAFWLEHGFITLDGDHCARTAKQSKAKLLFLDVDGVLNHSRSKEAIDADCLAHLAYIVKSTGATIILISSWKAGWFKDEKEYQDEDANYLDQRLKEVGLTIFDKSSRNTGHRVISVIDWVMKLNADSWAILDDDDFLYEESLLFSSCVPTRYNQGGLTLDLAERAIAILNDIDNL